MVSLTPLSERAYIFQELQFRLTNAV